jgi:putative tricarboxylic transport membrane protein
MTDRITGAVLLAFTLWYGAMAWGIERGFFSDPLGSRPFPLAVAIFLAPLALYLLLGRPVTRPTWAARGTWPALIFALFAFVVYAAIMEPLGFAVSNTIAFFALALVFRAPPLKGAIAAVVATVVIYVLFGILLELYLPTGELFEGWFG